ncbi:MAG: glycosyltransferase family 2 protein [Flavobacteriales bacterium]
MPGPTSLNISVVIPVYNAAKFIERGVRSALLFEEVKEVILVEDASPDNSLEVCKALAESLPRVRLYQHPGGVNQGAAASRNLGIAQSTQEYIAFLDADDFFLPNRFDAERGIFRDHPDADGVYGSLGAHYYDDEGRALYDSLFQEVFTVRKRVGPEELFEGLSGVIPDFGQFHLDALTVKRIALMGMDRLMRKEIHLHEDTDFIIRLAWYARLYPGSIDAPVAIRGVHRENRITRNDRVAHTELVLYRLLWEWAKATGVSAAARERFHYKYRLNEMRTMRNGMRATGLALRHRRYLERFDFREAYIRALAGEDTRFSRLLRNVGWRLYN